MPKKKGSKGPRKRINYVDVIESMRSKVVICSSAVREETMRNTVARVHLSLFKTLTATLRALQYVQLPGGGAAGGCGAGGGGPGGAGDSSGSVVGGPSEPLQQMQSAFSELRELLGALTAGGCCSSLNSGAAPGAGAEAATEPASSDSEQCMSGSIDTSDPPDEHGEGYQGEQQQQPSPPPPYHQQQQQQQPSPPPYHQQQQQQQQQQQDGAQGTCTTSGIAPASGSCCNGKMDDNAEMILIGAVAQSRNVDLTSGEFVGWWQQHVMTVAMMLHQYRRGATEHASKLEATVLSMNVRLMGLFLGAPWMAVVMAQNLETGVQTEAPQDVWDRGVEAMQLRRPQALALSLLNTWWKDQSSRFQAERQSRAQEALSAPEDLELQEEALQGLDRVQASYLNLAGTASIVVMGGILTHQQTAELYVQCWPFIPTLLSFLDAASHVAATMDAEQRAQEAERVAANGRQ